MSGVFMLRALPLVALSLAGCKEPLVVKSYLSLVNISPAAGAAGVGLDAHVVATFSEDLDPDTVDAQTAYMEDADLLPVIASVNYDDATRSIFISPEDALTEETSYLVTFTRDISGTQSGALGAVVTSQFTTSGAAQQNQIPLADAGKDQTGSVGTKVQLDGRLSKDPEGQDLTFSWRLVAAPSGTEAELSRDDAVKSSFLPDLPGEYMVGLTVNDGIEDSSEDFVSVTVSSAPDLPVDTGEPPDTGSDTGS
jgi:hypothetical protein